MRSSDPALEQLLTLTLYDRHFRSKLLVDPTLALSEAGIEVERSLKTLLADDLDWARSFARQQGLASERIAPPDLSDVWSYADVGTSVALVVMPFAAADVASIGVSILQTDLIARGVSTSVLYPNIDFCEWVGLETYEAVGIDPPAVALAGEWSFRGTVPSLDECSAYVRQVLVARSVDYFGWKQVFQLAELRDRTSVFLDALALKSEWREHRIVGFSSTFQQNQASLGLAARLKSFRPDTVVAFGGANCLDEMGRQILRSFGQVDFVIEGNAESSFADLALSILSNELPERKYETIAQKRSTSIEEVPTPSYESYYRRIASKSRSEYWVPIEFSRGCWWGEKRHCTFCGLNAADMSYRSKSTAQAVHEITNCIADAPGSGTLQVLIIDNILDREYFTGFFQQVADRGFDVEMQGEVRVDLTWDELLQLRNAGVRYLIPGVESLSNHVLRLMRKGSTCLQNIQFLKWCKELGLSPMWNYLYGFPGELDSDYSDIPQLIQFLHHLDPPSGVGRARADRFSPLHSEPGRLGVTAIHAEPSYRLVYPGLTKDEVSNLAYYFRIEAEYLASEDVIDQLRLSVGRWRSVQGRVRLVATWIDGSITVIDTRECSRVGDCVSLSRRQSELLLFCDRVRSSKAIVDRFGGAAADLGELIDLGFVVEHAGAYVGLAVLERSGMPDRILAALDDEKKDADSEAPAAPVQFRGRA